MSTPQELDAKMIAIDLDNIESIEEVFRLFYNNFIILLQNILENGCIESGYQNDSTIFNTEEIRISNFDEICRISNKLIRNEYYTRWPDKDKVAYLTTAFTTFLANQKLYKTFITDFVDQQNVPMDLTLEDKFGNYRRLIYNIEQFTIVILNRSQLNKIEVDLQTNCTSLISAAAKEVESTKTFYQNVSQNSEFTQENLENLESRISRALKALQNSAKASNILARITPGQTSLQATNKFTFKGPGNKVTQISNLSMEIQTVATKMENHTWDDQKVDFKQNQTYIDCMDSLKLGGNQKFKIPTQMPDLQFLQVKATEANNLNIVSPRPLSPLNPVTINNGDDSKEETDSDDTLSGGGDPTPEPKPTIKSEKEKANIVKFENALRNVRKTITRVEEALKTNLKKSRCQNLLGELKQVTEMGRNVLFKETTQDKKMQKRLEDAVDQCLVLQDSLTEILDEINSNEVLRQSLPKAAFPTWTGDPEGYLTFRQTMVPHLESLTTEPLKLSTLQHQMTGSSCEKIKKKLYGVNTLKKYIEELDKRYGDIEKVLPKKMEELKKLKVQPKNRIQESTNAEKLLSYCRMCQNFGAVQNINLVWVSQYANYLTENNACKMLGTKGDSQQVIKLLEKINEENEAYVDIQPETYNKSENSPDWKNNSLRTGDYNGGGNLNCFICQGQHKFTYCPLLDPRKSMKERERAILDKNLCLRCLYKWDPDHTCKQEERRFNCREHQRNYNICRCGKDSRNIDQLSDGKIQNNETEGESD